MTVSSFLGFFTKLYNAILDGFKAFSLIVLVILSTITIVAFFRNWSPGDWANWTEQVRYSSMVICWCITLGLMFLSGVLFVAGWIKMLAGWNTQAVYEEDETSVNQIRFEDVFQGVEDGTEFTQWENKTVKATVDNLNKVYAHIKQMADSEKKNGSYVWTEEKWRSYTKAPYKQHKQMRTLALNMATRRKNYDIKQAKKSQTKSRSRNGNITEVEFEIVS